MFLCNNDVVGTAPKNQLHKPDKAILGNSVGKDGRYLLTYCMFIQYYAV